MASNDLGDGECGGGVGSGILDGESDSGVVFLRMSRGMAGCRVY